MLEQGMTIISSVGRNDYAIRKVLQQFGGKKVYIVHTPVDAIDDEQMKLEITRNVSRIREFYDVDEVTIDLYDFYGNMRKFNSLIASIDGNIIADVTGGDPCVSQALLYSCLVSRKASIKIVYVKRPEHAGTDAIIPYPLLPCLTERQHEFVIAMKNGATIDAMMAEMSTTRSNTWNIANSLQDIGVVKIVKENGRVIPAYPGNIYIKE